MTDRTSHQTLRFAEALAPYGTGESAAAHTKLSISLPTELANLVRASAASTGLTVSATIAASLRRTLEDAEQAALDRALELDAEENLAWAERYAPTAAKLWAELEW